MLFLYIPITSENVFIKLRIRNVRQGLFASKESVSRRDLFGAGNERLRRSPDATENKGEMEEKVLWIKNRTMKHTHN